MRRTNDVQAWKGIRTRLAALLATLLLPASAGAAGSIVTIYDAFGAPSALEKDWGFAALVEYGGRRILFDTGNDAGVFARNVRRLKIDLRDLDAVVISHRHGDHTTGLSHVLDVNPRVKIYVPLEPAYFGSPVPRAFLEPEPALPPHLRYFDGKPPKKLASGTPWGRGNFEQVTKATEILPGVLVISTQSRTPGTAEMHELSLAVRTPRGLAIVVGCSHPGIEAILERAAAIDPKLYLVAGGFHLVQTPKPQIQALATRLDERLRVERIAPGHCTSEAGFAILSDRFKERFVAAGVGAVIPLP
jgi:7,8-dihydropterin-6-yl-methyl-4-(beta-D-ribofuranosyl)aminobenzene 5'-phosphate synthase